VFGLIPHPRIVGEGRGNGGPKEWSDGSSGGNGNVNGQVNVNGKRQRRGQDQRKAKVEGDRNGEANGIGVEGSEGETGVTTMGARGEASA
jgi:hypothetical protein